MGKQIIIFLLSAAFAISLTACGSASGLPSETEPALSEQETPSEIINSPPLDEEPNVSEITSTEAPILSNSYVNMVEAFNSDQHRTINIFLSNFAEQGMQSFDSENYDIERLIEFAFTHTKINKTAEITFDGQYECVSADIITSTIERYFGISITNQSTSWITYNNGQYMMRAASGESYEYVAIATEMYENGDGTYTVDFAVFRSADFPHSGSDSGWNPGEFYYYDFDTAASSPYMEWCYDGTAMVKDAAHNGSATYHLLSYEQK